MGRQVIADEGNGKGGALLSFLPHGAAVASVSSLGATTPLVRRWVRWAGPTSQ
jgi:hypothetical protein